MSCESFHSVVEPHKSFPKVLCILTNPFPVSCKSFSKVLWIIANPHESFCKVSWIPEILYQVLETLVNPCESFPKVYESLSIPQILSQSLWILVNHTNPFPKSHKTLEIISQSLTNPHKSFRSLGNPHKSFPKVSSIPANPFPKCHKSSWLPVNPFPVLHNHSHSLVNSWKSFPKSCKSLQWTCMHSWDFEKGLVRICETLGRDLHGFVSIQKIFRKNFWWTFIDFYWCFSHDF